ncbi:NAD(P)-binding protein [Chiua virens]|nr:NAD(P)-binding protein [Chiua virens]
MIAMSLEHNGATVYIVGRRLDVLQKAASENNRYGKIIPLQGDITSRESLLSMVQTLGIYSPLGYHPRSTTSTFREKKRSPPSNHFKMFSGTRAVPVGFTETFETNVTAVYYTTVAFLELLHLGNLRRGALPPKLVRTSKPLNDVSGGENGAYPGPESNGHSTPYHSLPPSPSSEDVPFPIDSDAPAVTPTTSMKGLQPPTSQVITISSSGSFRVDARVLSVSYTLAKHACTHLGKLLANLLADWNIRSNILCPGVWPSEMTNLDHLTPALLAGAVPIGRSGTLAEMAGPILFLAGRAGAYVNGAVWLGRRRESGPSREFVLNVGSVISCRTSNSRPLFKFGMDQS